MIAAQADTSEAMNIFLWPQPLKLKILNCKYTQLNTLGPGNAIRQSTCCRFPSGHLWLVCRLQESYQQHAHMMSKMHTNQERTFFECIWHPNVWICFCFAPPFGVSPFLRLCYQEITSNPKYVLCSTATACAFVLIR